MKNFHLILILILFCTGATTTAQAGKEASKAEEEEMPRISGEAPKLEPVVPRLTLMEVKLILKTDGNFRDKNLSHLNLSMFDFRSCDLAGAILYVHFSGTIPAFDSLDDATAE